jgi:hypothetical protein
VIISNLTRYVFLTRDGVAIRSARRRERRWGRGLVRTISAFPAVTRALILADTPNMRHDPVACLRGHRTDMSACVTRRARTMDLRRARTERAAATTTGSRYATLADVVCSYDPCPLVQGRIMLWRDQGHLTATFVRQLAPSVRAVALAALAPPGPRRS